MSMRTFDNCIRNEWVTLPFTPSMGSSPSPLLSVFRCGFLEVRRRHKMQAKRRGHLSGPFLQSPSPYLLYASHYFSPNSKTFSAPKFWASNSFCRPVATSRKAKKESTGNGIDHRKWYARETQSIGGNWPK